MVLFLNHVDLDGVTSATTGKGVNTSQFERKSVFVDVPVNTGAVTVSIEASNDNITWYTLDTKTYDAIGQDIFSYASYFKYMRSKTTTQSSSTVTTTFVGRE